MSLSSLIHNFVKANSVDDSREVDGSFRQDDSLEEVDETDKKAKGTKSKKVAKPQKAPVKTVTALKNDPTLKILSKYVRGGLSKMTKADLSNLTEGLKSYKKGVYTVGGKQITPDAEQELIIKAPVNRNIRVVAGAGTGKTTTITCRIKHLLDTCTTPDKILVLTFNVESRKNLETMIDRLMGFEIKVEIRTIDSFCLKIKNDFYADHVTSSTNEGDRQTINRSLSEFGVVGRQIMEKYGAEIASQYKYIFFDEFQDVDEDQFEILRCFSKNGCFLTVIGDDSQNIYQFRGSDNYYIINFDRLIPNTVTYKITTNYRSTQEIVNLANDSISNNKDKIFKLMKHHTDEKGTIDLTILNTSDDSIDHVMQMIVYYTQELGYDYSDIAILSRSTHPLKLLETEFERNKLPYVALISDQYSNEYKQIIQQNKIVLSTIHKAKGLEWRTVFMIGLADAYFPSHLNNGLKNIEEERRLFYVGSTRAKRHLHYVTDVKSIPLSRFLGEISHRLGEVINKTERWIDNDILFLGDDMNKVKDSYSVMKIVEMMNGRKIEKLREMSLIPNTKVRTDQVFTDPIFFTDNIKKNVFESDYGIFCDYYMTRQLMINNKQPIKDMHAEKILLDIHLTDEERMIYAKYNIKECLIKGQLPKVDPKNTKDVKLIKDLVEKLGSAIKMAKLTPHNIEYLLSMGISDYQYPKKFLKNLRRAYNVFKEPLRSNTEEQEIMDSIYRVSLCPKLNDDRRRLVYRDVYELYKENSELVLPRINEYVKKVSKNEILCKLQMGKLYKIDKETISFVGELDYIDITNNTIVDLKCSESDFKIEWLIQLLLYYALFMCNPDCCENYYDIVVNKVAIINIFTGKFYEIDIPADYDWQKLLDFVKEMIANDIKGIREKRTITVDDEQPIDKVQLAFATENAVVENDESKQEMTIVKVDPNGERSGYIVIDVENNSMNMDIIQMSYIVYNDKDAELKRVNSYIKDRFVDSRTNQITGITTDVLREKGVDFSGVIKTFVEDLSTVKILCGHHVHTDISKIRSNIEKFNIEIRDLKGVQIDPISGVSVSDTSVLYKTYKKLAKVNTETKSTSATLQNMYNDLFGKQMANAHDALSDVVHTAKCFVILKNKLTSMGVDVSERPAESGVSTAVSDDTATETNVTATASASTMPTKRMFRTAPKKLSSQLFESVNDKVESTIGGVSDTKVVKRGRPLKTKTDTDDDVSTKESVRDNVKRVVRTSSVKVRVKDKNMDGDKSELEPDSSKQLNKQPKKKGLALDDGLSALMSGSFFK
ncbi:Uvr helicase/DDEDDh 3'-5' exonuclease [Yasminevirus sp. GU-2018]|uniref:DNA 3'-5' helicase n=1 Tax=Yasminevirus sp. GU-2018 TaxID=2420051 RepID=A0A5K0U7L2_9VIRU|nr:Uvr helicase/DDEDDh 3'-5' exonuclease [Yasminevirus sp. GU-2018]